MDEQVIEITAKSPGIKQLIHEVLIEMGLSFEWYNPKEEPLPLNRPVLVWMKYNHDERYEIATRFRDCTIIGRSDYKRDDVIVAWMELPPFVGFD